MPTPADCIAAYILAKDGNRPHLMDAAFTPDATLKTVLHTDAIAFPAASHGRAAIAETLVRQFNQKYENIYTLCVGPAPDAGVRSFACDWLVAMSQKQYGAVRIGCGSYDWSFTPSGERVRALTITIETMALMQPDTLAPVMAWVAALPYPWCPRAELSRAAPRLPGVEQSLKWLGRPGIA
jgi:hypothetical protein